MDFNRFVTELSHGCCGGNSGALQRSRSEPAMPKWGYGDCKVSAAGCQGYLSNPLLASSFEKIIAPASCSRVFINTGQWVGLMKYISIQWLLLINHHARAPFSGMTYFAVVSTCLSSCSILSHSGMRIWHAILRAQGFASLLSLISCSVFSVQPLKQIWKF